MTKDLELRQGDLVADTDAVRSLVPLVPDVPHRVSDWKNRETPRGWYVPSRKPSNAFQLRGGLHLPRTPVKKPQQVRSLFFFFCFLFSFPFLTYVRFSLFFFCKAFSKLRSPFPFFSLSLFRSFYLSVPLSPPFVLRASFFLSFFLSFFHERIQRGSDNNPHSRGIEKELRASVNLIQFLCCEFFLSFLSLDFSRDRHRHCHRRRRGVGLILMYLVDDFVGDWLGTIFHNDFSYIYIYIYIYIYTKIVIRENEIVRRLPRTRMIKGGTRGGRNGYVMIGRVRLRP